MHCRGPNKSAKTSQATKRGQDSSSTPDSSAFHRYFLFSFRVFLFHCLIKRDSPVISGVIYILDSIHFSCPGVQPSVSSSCPSQV